MTLSALQIAQAYSVFANEGNFIELNLFKDHSFDEPYYQKIIEPTTNSKIKKMLIETVNSKTGTASKARLEGKILQVKLALPERR